LTDNLIDIEAPVGEFRQLKSKNTGKEHKAADFWKSQKEEYEHFITEDGKWYVKRDPETGRILFYDMDKKRFAGYGLDDDNYFTTFEELIKKFKYVNGLDGGKLTITTPNGTIELTKDKANIILGRLNPSLIPGGTTEIGINQIKDELGLLRNYSFANNGFELTPHSIHILNISDAMDKTGDFFLDFNLDFLKLITKNPEDVRVILATKPEFDYLCRWENGDEIMNAAQTHFIPSIYAQEIKYLYENGIINVKLFDGTIINLNDIDLSKFDWSKWSY
jgi:hypothetical protein